VEAGDVAALAGRVVALAGESDSLVLGREQEDGTALLRIAVPRSRYKDFLGDLAVLTLPEQKQDLESRDAPRDPMLDEAREAFYARRSELGQTESGRRALEVSLAPAAEAESAGGGADEAMMRGGARRQVFEAGLEDADARPTERTAPGAKEAEDDQAGKLEEGASDDRAPWVMLLVRIVRKAAPR